MMKLKKLWETLLYNYFFLPTLMAVIGMGPALGMLTLDRALPSEPWGLWAGSTRVDRMGRAPCFPPLLVTRFLSPVLFSRL